MLVTWLAEMQVVELNCFDHRKEQFAGLNMCEKAVQYI